MDDTLDLEPTAATNETQAGSSELDRWAKLPEGAFATWMRARSFGRHRAVHFDDRSTNQYASMFGAFARWAREKRRAPITALTEGDLDQFAHEGLRHTSDVTRWRYLRLIARVYDHLRALPADGQTPAVTDNPAQQLMARMRAPARSAPVFLSEQQTERYIDWVCRQPVATWMDSRDRALRAVFLASGITLEEARALTLDDVRTLRDEGDGAHRLLIRELRIAGHQLTPAHAAPVAAWAQEPLVHWFSLRSALGMDSQLLFLARERDFHMQSPAQEAMSSTEIFVCIQAAMEAIGHRTERQGAQTLRNTFIARQLIAGVDAQRIAQWTGLRSEGDTIAAIARQLPYTNGVQAV